MTTPLLTYKERKVIQCIAEGIKAKRPDDLGKRQASQVVEAVEALITVLDDHDTAEKLSPWNERLP